jgi:2,3,4,5-tetrahydropyridine-2-carboxylate N-succinyltransferase
MSIDKLAHVIDEAFEGRDKIGPKTKGAVRKTANSGRDLLRNGARDVAERDANGQWQVNQWLKKAVLLSFRLNDMRVIPGGPGKAVWWDKVDSKFKGWNAARFRKAGFRAVPGCVVRRSAFIAPGVVLMPSLVNLGAYVDSGTMIDTWATVGSCAQIGKNCHISGGAGIGGVLEPVQAGPVIIEDNCFVGARSEVAEGVIVRSGACYRWASISALRARIVDRETGSVMQGEVPLFGRRARHATGQKRRSSLYCVVMIVKCFY